MMKQIFVWAWVIFPLVSFAGTESHLQTLELNPIHSDVSMAYLANMFGVVDGVLHGTGTQILGKMFAKFNTILFSFAGLLWAYTSFIGILNTASQGQFLGQRWSSMWVPFRIVSGAVFLLPKATTGYSMIQILVMYIVLQGIGAANRVWDTTLNYLERSGTIVEFAQPLRSIKALNYSKAAMEAADNSHLIQTAGKILKAEVAMLSVYNAMERQGRALGLSPLPHFSQTLYPEKEVNDYMIQFPGPLYGGDKIKGLCGYVKWNEQGESSALTGAAVQLMLTQLLPIAQKIADDIVPLQAFRDSVVPDALPPHEETTSVPFPPHVQVTIQKPIQPLNDPFLPYNGALIHAASDFFGLIKPELRAQQNQATQEMKNRLGTMKREGWILAGSYYYRLAEFNQKANHFNKGLSIPPNKISAYFSVGKDFKEKLGDDGYRKAFDAYLNRIDRYIQAEENRATSSIYYNPKLSPGVKAGGVDFGNPEHRNAYNEELFNPFIKNMQRFQHHMEATMQSQIDPIIALAKIGNALVQAVKKVWNGLMESETPFDKWNDKLVLLPLGLIWMTLNFTLGATLLYYIPLMPFLLFFFGSLTWFAFVIEAMVAAPLIALGMTHPEGHDFFGKAEQAVMLLASIFLRPMLMIFGFILGMIFCAVAFNLFHYGYGIAVEAVGIIEGEDWLKILTHTAMMIVYTTTAVTIVNRSFALIYEIPNRALRWMGGPTEGHNDAEGAMQVKSSVERYAQEAGSLTRPANK
jgi:defect-in-organelle-trafficking protein DotA